MTDLDPGLVHTYFNHRIYRVPGSHAIVGNQIVEGDMVALIDRTWYIRSGHPRSPRANKSVNGVWLGIWQTTTTDWLIDYRQGKNEIVGHVSSHRPFVLLFSPEGLKHYYLDKIKEIKARF